MGNPCSKCFDSNCCCCCGEIPHQRLSDTSSINTSIPNAVGEIYTIYPRVPAQNRENAVHVPVHLPLQNDNRTNIQGENSIQGKEIRNELDLYTEIVELETWNNVSQDTSSGTVPNSSNKQILDNVPHFSSQEESKYLNSDIQETSFVAPDRRNVLSSDDMCSTDVQNGELNAVWCEKQYLKVTDILKMEKSKLSTSLENINMDYEATGETTNGNSSSDICSEPTNLQEYVKRSGYADMTGELYEVKLATLFYLIGLSRTKEFHLATNFQHAGAFDDIVFSYERGNSRKTAYFLQLKHRKNKIRHPSLFQEKNDFGLLKYWKSYREIKSHSEQLDFLGKFEDFYFVLYTNAGVKEMGVKDSTETDVIIKTGGHTYRFCDDFNDLLLYKQLLDCVYSLFFNQVEMIPATIIDYENRIKNKEILYKLKALKNVLSLDKIQSLREEVNAFSDLNEYGEFLKKVTLFAEQASEANLDARIKREIELLLGTGNKSTDMIFSILLQHMTLWWKECSYFLTKDAPMWTDIIKTCTASLNTSRFSKIIRFKDASVEALKNIVSQDSSTIFIECSPKGSPLVCQKLQQMLENKIYLIVNQATLLSRINEIIALLRSERINIAIINLCSECVLQNEYGHTIHTNSQNNMMNCIVEFLLELVSFLQNFKDKQLIILIPVGFSLTNHLQERFECNLKCIKIRCNLNELNAKSQEEILSQILNFQGQQVQMRKVVNDDPTLKQYITDDIIVPLVIGKQQMNVGSRLDKQIPYYVRRELKTERGIRWKILLEYVENHIFVVSCVKEEDISKLAKRSNNIILGSKDEYIYQCTIHPNVHWLQTDGDVLCWRESQGDITPLKKHLVKRSTFLRHIDSINDVPDRVFLLIAEPGMGKSTFLTHLAIRTKQKFPVLWIIRLNFINHTLLLEGINEHTWNVEKTVQFLLAATDTTSALGSILMKHSLLCSGNVILLLDGFDEISPTHADKAFVLLKFLKTTAIQKMWITSRPVMKQKLEQVLCVPTHFLQPLDEESQKLMLYKYWEPKINVNFDSNHLDYFIWQLLYRANKTLQHKDFTTIPLHVVMLATAFEKKLATCNETGIVNLPDKFNLLGLYDTFIAAKLEIYYKEKLRADHANAVVQDLRDDLKQVFLDNHMRAALLALLTTEHLSSQHNKTLLENTETFLEKIQEGREKAGIIFHVKAGKPRFIHRTFAEYFMAHWFTRFFKHNIPLMEEILFATNYGTTRVIFDTILACGMPLHLAVLSEDVYEVTNLCNTNNVNKCDKGGRTALHLAALQPHSQEVVQITRLLIEAGAATNITDNVLNWTPLDYAWKMESWNVVGELLKKEDRTLSKQKFEANINDILNVAAEGDYMELLEVIDEKAMCLNKITESDLLQTTAHIAALNGSIRVIKWLHHNGCDFSCVDVEGNTPLHLAALGDHLEVVQLLVEKSSSDIHLRNYNGENALDMALAKTKYGSSNSANYLRKTENENG